MPQFPVQLGGGLGKVGMHRYRSEHSFTAITLTGCAGIGLVRPSEWTGDMVAVTSPFEMK